MYQTERQKLTSTDLYRIVILGLMGIFYGLLAYLMFL